MSVLAVAVVAVVGVGGFRLVRAGFVGLASGSPPGKLRITSSPTGTTVLLDGSAVGVTPLALTVPPGEHSVALRLNGTERAVPVVIAAGSDVAQHFELAADDSPVQFGRLAIATDPPGARVTIDGRPRGMSPLTVSNLAPTVHTIRVASDAGTAERSVVVERGALTSVVFALSRPSSSAAGVPAGWISLAAPFQVEVLEGNEVLGSSASAKIMTTVGRHDLTLVNRSLKYKASRRVDVAAGKVSTVRIEAPKAAVSVNARPWADVLVDAKAVGQTPIANLLVPIGKHTVVFRHPTLGERQQSIVVSVEGPNRVAIDLTR